MPTEERYFVRIAVPSTITLTVQVPPDSSVKDIRDATQDVLRSITDAEDQLDLSKVNGYDPEPPVDPLYDAVLHFDTAEEQTQDMKTIFTGVKKSRILDSYKAVVDVPLAPFAEVK